MYSSKTKCLGPGGFLSVISLVIVCSVGCKTLDSGAKGSLEASQASAQRLPAIRAWADVELWMAQQPPVVSAKADERHLELVHLLLEQKKLEEAELILDGLRADPRPGILVKAWNAQGLLEALRDDPYAAEQAWQKAMELDPAALYLRRNLAALYLRYGFFDKVLAMIEPSPSDFELAYLRLVAERNLGQNKVVDRRCAQLLDDHPKHPGLLYSCSLHEFQNNRHAERAIQLMTSCLKHIGDDKAMRDSAESALAEMRKWRDQHQR